jgi:hypothetical protein
VPQLADLVKTNFTDLRVEESTIRVFPLRKWMPKATTSPVTERNWLLKLRVAENAPTSLAFHFQKCQSPAQNGFQRYADATRGRRTETGAGRLDASPASVAVDGAGCGVVRGVGSAVWWLRRHQPEISAGLCFAGTTPFTVIAFATHAGRCLMRWSDANRAGSRKTFSVLRLSSRATATAIRPLTLPASAGGGWNWPKRQVNQVTQAANMWSHARFAGENSVRGDGLSCRY